MASHHHYHQYHPQTTHPHTTITTTTAAAAAASSCCRCCCSCSPQDPLVGSISSHLCHPLTPTPHHPQPTLHSPYLNSPPYYLHNQQNEYYYPPQPQPHKQKEKYRQNREEDGQIQPIVSSLLRRIAALESSLRRQSSGGSHHSLRDAAARTIQTHFRAFLVRRSRTLRQLKDLAFIKSALNTLKSSLSDNAQFDPQSLSHQATHLLVKLDSIQGVDPMIRDGKRSISKELFRFLGFLDELSVKRGGISSRVVRNVRIYGDGTKSRVLHRDQRMVAADCGGLGGKEREVMDKLREEIDNINGYSRVSVEEDGYEDEEDVKLENPTLSSVNGKCGVSHNRMGGLVKRRGGIQCKVRKSVSFAENGNAYRVFRSRHGPVLGGDCNSVDGSDSVDERELLMENISRQYEDIRVLSKETEHDDKEAQFENEDLPHPSDHETELRRRLTTEANMEMRRLNQIRGDDASFAFSAPLPVTMESRADLMNKKKTVTVIK